MRKILIIVMMISMLILLSGCEVPDEFKQRCTEYEITIMDENGNIVNQYNDYYIRVSPDRSGVIEALTPDYRWVYISGGIVSVKETDNFYFLD